MKTYRIAASNNKGENSKNWSKLHLKWSSLISVRGETWREIKLRNHHIESTFFRYMSHKELDIKQSN